jgi:hypothetical protein
MGTGRDGTQYNRQAELKHPASNTIKKNTMITGYGSIRVHYKEDYHQIMGSSRKYNATVFQTSTDFVIPRDI